MKRKKRQALTLVEMMLVIVLIGVIGGAVAFNLRGALDKGRSFKTQETKKKIEAVINIAYVDKDENEILTNWPQIVAESPLIKVKVARVDAQDTILDGWGTPFSIQLDNELDQFVATSSKIDSHGEIISK